MQTEKGIGAVARLPPPFPLFNIHYYYWRYCAFHQASVEVCGIGAPLLPLRGFQEQTHVTSFGWQYCYHLSHLAVSHSLPLGCGCKYDQLLQVLAALISPPQ